MLRAHLLLLVLLLPLASPCGYPYTLGDVQLIIFEDQCVTLNFDSLYPSNLSTIASSLVDFEGQPYIDGNGNFVNLHPYTSLLIITPSKTILVDDGVGVAAPVVLEQIPVIRLSDQLVSNQYPASSIDIVIHTHIHRGHTGWDVDRNFAIMFPNAKYYIQMEEILYWNSSSDLRQKSNFDQIIGPLINGGVLVMVSGAYRITPEVVMFPCVGHTPGHQCVLIESGNKTAIHVGDAMHKPFQVQKPDWTMLMDYDVNQAISTRWELIKNVTSSGALMIGVHFPFPGMGYLHSSNNGDSGYIYYPLNNGTNLSPNCPIAQLNFVNSARFYIIIVVVIVLGVAASIAVFYIWTQQSTRFSNNNV